jgi:hypothetical protein
MRVQIPLVVEMTEEQARRWAEEHGLGERDGRLYARDVVDSVRAAILEDAQDGKLNGRADVSIRR